MLFVLPVTSQRGKLPVFFHIGIIIFPDFFITASGVHICTPAQIKVKFGRAGQKTKKILVSYMLSTLPSVLRRCWLGSRKGIWPVKTEWWDAGMVM